MVKKEQKIRYSDEEMMIIKNTFAENDDLLKVVRKIFLQLPLSEVEERAQINTFVNNPNLMKVVRKSFLPTLEDDAPIMQLTDLWATLQITDKTPEVALPHILARKGLIDYLDEQLKVLSREIIIPVNKINYFEQTNDAVEKYTNLIMRNTVVQHVEQVLFQFKLLAGTKDETPEQTLKRLQQNSNK